MMAAAVVIANSIGSVAINVFATDIEDVALLANEEVVNSGSEDSESEEIDAISNSDIEDTTIDDNYSEMTSSPLLGSDGENGTEGVDNEDVMSSQSLESNVLLGDSTTLSATYTHRDLCVEYIHNDSEVFSENVIKDSVMLSRDEDYEEEDEILVENGKKYYVGHAVKISDSPMTFRADAWTRTSEDNGVSDTKEIIYTATDDVDSSLSSATFVLSSDSFNITPSTVTLPVKHARYEDKQIVEGTQYTTVIGPRDSRGFYFTPALSGNYTFNGTGGVHVEIWISGDDKDSTDYLEKTIVGKNRKFGYGSTSKIQTFPLIKGQNYWFSAWQDRIEGEDESLTFTVTKDGDNSSSATGSSTGKKSSASKKKSTAAKKSSSAKKKSTATKKKSSVKKSSSSKKSGTKKSSSKKKSTKKSSKKKK